MQQRSGCTVALLVLILAVLLFLVVWSLTTLGARPSPLEVVTTIEQQLKARLNPTPTVRPSPATIVRAVQRLSRLETVSFTVEKVITAESGQDALAFLFGDRLLFVAHGQVVAGIDLGQVREGDVTVTNDDRVLMALPPPEVFVVALDNEKSFVYDRDTGILGLNQQLESAARQAAEQEILRAALADGILDMADANARAYLQQFIISLGFREVVFIQATPTPPPPTLPVTVIPSTVTP